MAGKKTATPSPTDSKEATQKVKKEQQRNEARELGSISAKDLERQSLKAKQQAAIDRETQRVKDEQLKKEAREKRELLALQGSPTAADGRRKRARVKVVGAIGKILTRLAEEDYLETPEIEKLIDASAKGTRSILQRMTRAKFIRRATARNSKNAKVYRWYAGNHPIFR